MTDLHVTPPTNWPITTTKTKPGSYAVTGQLTVITSSLPVRQESDGGVFCRTSRGRNKLSEFGR